MRNATLWERFKKHFAWGKWSWKTLGFYHGYILVIGKLKIIFPEKYKLKRRSTWRPR